MSGAVIIVLLMLSAGVWMLLEPRDSRRFQVFVLAWAMALYSLVCGAVLNFENAMLPLKYDGSLYRIDVALGLCPFPLAHALGHGWIGILISCLYTALLPMMLLSCAVGLHRRWKGPSVLWAYLVELVIGPCLYALVPAIGPTCAFFSPAKPPLSVPEITPLSGIPNAMPSLHVSTALLLLLFAQGRFWKALSFTFLLCTGLATLVVREHYTIDLIVAVPFAFFVASAVHRRSLPAAAYLALMLAWLLSIRAETPILLTHPVTLRVAALLTIASGLRFRLRPLERIAISARTDPGPGVRSVTPAQIS